MPKFPRAHSDQKMTTRQPAALHPGADVIDSSGNYKALAQGAGNLMAKAQEWQAYVDRVQGDTAKHQYKSKLMEISNEAANDPNLMQNIGVYQKRMKDAQKASMQGANNYVKNSIAPDMDLMGQIAGIGLQKAYNDQVIQQDHAILLEEYDMAAQQGNIKRIKELSEMAVQKNTLDRLAAKKQELKWTAKAKENTFMQDMTFPAMAEKNLTKNTYGFDIKELSDAWKVFDREIGVIQNQNEATLDDLMRQKTPPDEGEIDQMRKDKKIGAAYAKSYVKDMNNVSIPKPDSLDAVTEANILAEKFNALRKKEDDWFYLSRASFDQRSQFRADLFEAHRNGFITTKLRDEYLEATSKEFFSSKEFTNAMDQVIETSGEYVGKEERAIAQQKLTQAFLNKVIGGMKPAQALKVVTNERIEADFPGYKADDLLHTSRETGLSLKAVYDLLQKKKGEGTDAS